MEYKYSSKNLLTKEDVVQIKKLESACQEKEHITMKLELDYKYADAVAKNFSNDISKPSEFFCHREGELYGYFGVCQFGSSVMEITGMVHPDHRQSGIASSLMKRIGKARGNKETEALILTDSKSESGKAFVLNLGGELSFKEYEMELDFNDITFARRNPEIYLTKAANIDALEIEKQNRIFEQRFNPKEELVPSTFPEDEEKKGYYIYLAKIKDSVIGKIHLTVNSDGGWIYGLFVYPEYRGKGYGRTVLRAGFRLLAEMGAETFKLQVDSLNKTALGLYRSVGFHTVSAMEYYRIYI